LIQIYFITARHTKRQSSTRKKISYGAFSRNNILDENATTRNKNPSFRSKKETSRGERERETRTNEMKNKIVIYKNSWRAFHFNDAGSIKNVLNNCKFER
jgi:hypothetical protein